MRLHSCERRRVGALLTVLFCAKSIVSDSHNFGLAKMKKFPKQYTFSCIQHASPYNLVISRSHTFAFRHWNRSPSSRDLSEIWLPLRRHILNTHLLYLWKTTAAVSLIFISYIRKVQVNLISELSENATLSPVNSVRFSLARWGSTYTY